MSQISPPIRILLVCAVAFLAAWMLFLRPSTDDRRRRPPRRRSPPRTPRRSRPAAREADSAAGKVVEQANEATAATGRRAPSGSPTARETAADAGARRERPAGDATATAAEARREQGRRQAGQGRPRPPPPAASRSACSARSATARSSSLLFWSPKAADDKAVRKALTRHRPPRRQGPRARDAHQADRRLPADHARRQRRAVADHRGHRPQPQGARRSSATSIARTIDQAVTDALRK